MRDLRFTFDEAADYLQRELNQAVDAKTVALVEESAEGWIAGLHLAVLYLQHQTEPGAAAAQLKGHNRFTADYLAFEVLAKQGAETQEFLLKTSILPRMCPALCEAVLAAVTRKQARQRRAQAQLAEARRRTAGRFSITWTARTCLSRRWTTTSSGTDITIYFDSS